MGAEHEGIRRCGSFQEGTAGGPGNVGIGVSASRPLRMAALNRVMNDVTSDHAAVADPHTHVPGGVPWRVP